MASTQFLQKAYLAYFGRPVDTQGALTYASASDAAVTNAFSGSAESQSLYGASFGTAQVNAIYQMLFGRDAEPAGLTYWVNRVNAGTVSPAGAALAILEGAQNADATAITNKIATSALFTAGLDTTTEILGYSGNTAAATARTFLKTVTTTAATQAAVDAAIVSTVSAGSTGTGSTFTLTVGVDSLTGTSGADTFVGDSASISPADTISGGAGVDTAKLYINEDESLVASDVELFNVQATAAKTLTASNITGATSITSDKSTTTLAVTGVQNNVTIGAVGSTASATDDMKVTFASGKVGSATATLALAVDGLGAAAGRYEFDVNTAGTDVFTTVEVTGSNTKSFIELDAATAASLALTKVVAKGAALVDFGDAPSKLGNVATVDASASTGGLKIDLATSTNAKDVTFTGGTGADTVVFAATQFTTLDKIDGGTGTDTIVTGDAVFTASTDAVVKALNGATGVEVAGSSVTAADGIQVKMSVLTAINTFTFGGVTPAANAADADGDIAAALTGIESTDSFIITGNVVGGTSANGESSGGDAINALPLVNSGSDTLSLTFKAGAAIAVTGGASVDKGGDGGKVGGDALDAATIEKINITTDSAADDVTFTGGALAGKDTAGSSVKVGANAIITIVGAGDVTLGTIVAPSTDADDVTVDGNTMTGALSVTTGAGNDVIKGGSKADTITAGTGVDTITLGGGSDIYNITKGDAVGSHDIITDFLAGGSGDILKGLSASYDALTNAEQTAVTAELTLAAAVNTALVGATDSQWTAFTYGSKTYAVYDTNNTFDTTDGYIVELTGVTVANLTAANFAA